MTGHKRVARKAKVVIEHGKIRVTDTAVANFDFDFLRTELAWVIAERFKWTFGGLRCVGVIGGHEFLLGLGVLFKMSVVFWTREEKTSLTLYQRKRRGRVGRQSLLAEQAL